MFRNMLFGLAGVSLLVAPVAAEATRSYESAAQAAGLGAPAEVAGARSSSPVAATEGVEGNSEWLLVGGAIAIILLIILLSGDDDDEIAVSPG